MRDRRQRHSRVRSVALLCSLVVFIEAVVCIYVFSLSQVPRSFFLIIKEGFLLLTPPSHSSLSKLANSIELKKIKREKESAPQKSYTSPPPPAHRHAHTTSIPLCSTPLPSLPPSSTRSVAVHFSNEFMPLTPYSPRPSLSRRSNSMSRSDSSTQSNTCSACCWFFFVFWRGRVEEGVSVVRFYTLEGARPETFACTLRSATRCVHTYTQIHQHGDTSHLSLCEWVCMHACVGGQAAR